MCTLSEWDWKVCGQVDICSPVTSRFGSFPSFQCSILCFIAGGKSSIIKSLRSFLVSNKAGLSLKQRARVMMFEVCTASYRGALVMTDCCSD